MSKSAKKKAWDWCSKYIRLRDALAYCKTLNIDIKQFARIEDLPVECCDCNSVKPWVQMDAGHYIGRGLYGKSGTYFDERNIHAQGKLCNAGFRGDTSLAYTEFMFREYGQKVVDELHIKHKTHTYSQIEIVGLGEYYKQEYENLCKTVSLELKTE
jgi:hypothetical protein